MPCTGCESLMTSCSMVMNLRRRGWRRVNPRPTASILGIGAASLQRQWAAATLGSGGAAVHSSPERRRSRMADQVQITARFEIEIRDLEYQRHAEAPLL